MTERLSNEQELEAQRAISDAELIKGGARYEERPEGKRLVVTDKQRMEIKGEHEEEQREIERLMSPEFIERYRVTQDLIERKRDALSTLSQANVWRGREINRFLKELEKADRDTPFDQNLWKFREDLDVIKNGYTAVMETDVRNVIEMVNRFCTEYNLPFEAISFMDPQRMRRGVRAAYHARMFELGMNRDRMIE